MVIDFDPLNDKINEGKDNVNRILEFPNKIFHPHRILILKILWSHWIAEFNDLKNTLKLSDGSLSNHIKTLSNLGYIEIEKEILPDNKVMTYYQLTKKGYTMTIDLFEAVNKITELEKS